MCDSKHGLPWSLPDRRDALSEGETGERPAMQSRNPSTLQQSVQASAKKAEQQVKTYKLVAVPFLLWEGEFEGHLETVTFIAVNEERNHKWWEVNVGTFESDFRKVVSPELARHVVEKLRAGETVSSSLTGMSW